MKLLCKLLGHKWVLFNTCNIEYCKRCGIDKEDYIKIANARIKPYLEQKKLEVKN